MFTKNPSNEIETVILFSQLCTNNPGINILSYSGKYPDAIIEWAGKIYRVEFEFLAYNFYIHRHNPRDCDIIICWKNDYPDSVLPIVALNNPEWETTDLTPKIGRAHV